MDSEGLRKAFASYGDISDCRVMRDHLTNKSKGYGFVSFANSSDAQQAMQQGGHSVDPSSVAMRLFRFCTLFK